MYVYIASPYSHSDRKIRTQRYYAAMEYTAKLLNDGIHCFSPIVHSHALAQDHDLPLESDFWREWNYSMLEHASELRVLMMDGWSESKGVDDEITRAQELGIAVTLVTVEQNE